MIGSPLDVVMAYTLFAVGRSGDIDVVLDYTASTDWLKLRMRAPGAETWNRAELGHGSLYMPELRRALSLEDDSRPGMSAAGVPFALPFDSIVGDAVRGVATYTVAADGERIDLALERPLLLNEAAGRA